MSTIDQAIVERLAALLGRIRIGNGFASDAGAHVLVEQTRDDVPESAATLAIFDESELLSEGGQAYQKRAGILTVVVEGSLPVALQGPEGPIYQPVRAQARKLMADVRRAVAGQKLTDFVTGVTDIRITGRLLPQLQDGSSYQLCSVTFAFRFTESHLPKEQAT